MSSKQSQQLQSLLQQAQQQERCARDLPGMESAADALLDAVTRGKSHLVKFLLAACEKEVEVAINYRDFKGKTPLIRAVYITEEKCRQRIIELLLAHGADPNSQDETGRTALSYACELRRNDVVRMLVKHNVDPELPDAEGNTPLMHCARVGNDTGIVVLIKCFKRLGLDIDRCNREGCTALLIAAKLGYVESASLLAVAGRASVTRTDPEFGRNAEQWARAQGCTTPEVAAFSQVAVERRRRRLRAAEAPTAATAAGSSASLVKQARPSRSSTLTTRVSWESRDEAEGEDNEDEDLDDDDADDLELDDDAAEMLDNEEDEEDGEVGYSCESGSSSDGETARTDTRPSK